MNRLCQKKLFMQIHKHTTNWNQPQLPAQWGSMVKSRGMWYSSWAGTVSSSWSEARHQHIKISPQVIFFNTMLDVPITMFPPAPAFTAKCLLYSWMLAQAANQIVVQTSSSLRYCSPVSCQSVAHTKAHYTQILLAVPCQPWFILFRPCQQCSV